MKNRHKVITLSTLYKQKNHRHNIKRAHNHNWSQHNPETNLEPSASLICRLVVDCEVLSWTAAWALVSSCFFMSCEDDAVFTMTGGTALEANQPVNMCKNNRFYFPPKTTKCYLFYLTLFHEYHLPEQILEGHDLAEGSTRQGNLKLAC